jgi:hypothetical protein
MAIIVLTRPRFSPGPEHALGDELWKSESNNRSVPLMSIGGIGMLYLFNSTLSTATRASHLLPVIEGYARLAALRIFEIAFRLYSFPV